MRRNNGGERREMQEGGEGEERSRKLLLWVCSLCAGHCAENLKKI